MDPIRNPYAPGAGKPVLPDRGDIADTLGIRVQTAGPLRNGLIRKGMIYSPAHGDIAFTVPLFDQFLRRVMPSWLPRAD